MSVSRNGWEQASSRPRDGVHRRFRALAAVALALALTGGVVLAGAGAAAWAEPSDSPVAPTEVAPTAPSPTGVAPTATPPSAAPTETPAPLPIPPPDAPVISSPADGALIDGSAWVAGTATPDSTLQILAGGSSEPLCIVTADASGGFSCEASGLASSPSTSIRVIELADSGNVSSTVTVRVLTAPVVTGGPRGALTNAVVQGSAYPGASVTADAGDLSCTGTADGSGAWSCPLSGPSGIRDGDYRVSATQATSWSDGASSAASESVAIQIDATVPAAPVLLSPAPGAVLPLSGAVFSGSGEAGAAVSVFAGPQVLCEAVVADGGSWSCTAAPVPAGTYSLAVLQQDAAGNVSVQSGPLSLAFQAAGTGTPTPTATNPPGSASPTAPGSTAPQSPEGIDGSAAAPPGSASGSPDGSGTESPAPDLGDGGVVPPGSAPDSGTWTDATRFSAALQPALGAQAQSVWWIALVAGLLALALIALPSRLLSATVGASVAASARPGAATSGASPAMGAPLAALGRLLGRNRSRVEYDRAPEVRIGPALRAVATLVAAAAIVTLSNPVLGQPAYLRLFLAVVAALFVVNVVATLVPATLARKVFGVVARPRLSPGLLLLTTALALVSRLAELDPVLVFGLVAGLGATVTASTTRVARGRLATVQVLCLLVLGAFAWLAGGAATAAVAAASGGASGASPELWITAVAEFTNVVTLASFGSASVLLLPVAGSAGRRILAFSPATWTLLALASYTALAMLFVPTLITAADSGGLVLPVVLAVGFAAICLSAWAWMRFVAADDEPVPDPS